MTFRSFRLCAQLAEVKVRILEAKQTLEDFITAQEFSRAAELKDTITELENRRNAILQEIAASSQPVDKEVHGEKVHDHAGSIIIIIITASVLRDFPPGIKKHFCFFPE